MSIKPGCKAVLPSTITLFSTPNWEGGSETFYNSIVHLNLTELDKIKFQIHEKGFQNYGRMKKKVFDVGKIDPDIKEHYNRMRGQTDEKYEEMIDDINNVESERKIWNNSIYLRMICFVLLILFLILICIVIIYCYCYCNGHFMQCFSMKSSISEPEIQLKNLKPSRNVSFQENIEDDDLIDSQIEWKSFAKFKKRK